MREFDIIKQLFQRSQSDVEKSAQGQLILGIGDDAAVLAFPAGYALVTCMDTLVEGRHFYPHASAYAIGHKALAVNISDCLAMGAKPHSFTLGLTCPTGDEAWLAEFAEGLFDCAKHYGVMLVGGDTTQGPLTITIQLNGLVLPQHLVKRTGAQVGDLIAVTGDLGAPAYALKHQSMNSKLDFPWPPLKFSQELHHFASAAIDISDGLLQDLGHLLNASHLGATLEAEKLPAAHEQVTLEQMLEGGDEYELCFTLPPCHLAACKIFAEQSQTRMSIIGTVNSNMGIALIDAAGIHRQLVPRGWQHFS